MKKPPNLFNTYLIYHNGLEINYDKKQVKPESGFIVKTQSTELEANVILWEKSLAEYVGRKAHHPKMIGLCLEMEKLMR